MKKIVKKKYTLFIAILFLLNISCYSQDTIRQSHFLFNGYIKDLQTVIFQDIKSDWTTANLIHNRLNFKYIISPSVTIALELRNRFFYGDMLKTYQGYNKTFEQDNGIVRLSKNIIDEKSFLLNTSVDRAWLEYTKDKFQLTIGRQRINWGQTLVWNPNDIFNTYSYFDFDYEEKPGSDAVRLQYYSSPTSVIEIAAKSNNNKKITVAGLYRLNKWNYDFQFIGGEVDQTDYIIGTGWSGQVLKGGFRGEASYFSPMKNFGDTTGVLVASIEYDYTFKNSLLLQFEALYNGYKDTLNVLSLAQLNTNSMNAKNLFLSDYSFFLSANYPFTPLINTSLSGIANPKLRLYFIIPSITISLKDNLELSLIAQLFRYCGNGNANQNVNYIFLRLKSSF